MTKKEDWKARKKMMKGGKPLGPVFFTAWIGAFIYFEQIAHGFWPSVLAFLKSIVWPAYVVLHVLRILHA